MAREPKPINRGSQSAPPLAQQQAIAEQTAKFLAGGGKIQKIPSGVSGQPLGVAAKAVAPRAKSAR